MLDIGRDSLLVMKLDRSDEEWAILASIPSKYGSDMEAEKNELERVRRTINIVCKTLDDLQDQLRDLVAKNAIFSDEDRKSVVEIAPRARECFDLLRELDSATNWNKVSRGFIAWVLDRILANGFWSLVLSWELLLSCPKQDAVREIKSIIHNLILGETFNDLMRFFAYLKIEKCFSADPRHLDFIPSAIIHARFFHGS